MGARPGIPKGFASRFDLGIRSEDEGEGRMDRRADAAAALAGLGQHAYERGWVPATSGNFSMRLGADEILITVSGSHKGRLTPEDLLRVDLQGRPLEETRTGTGRERRPSAETRLHLLQYQRDAAVHAVLHTHSVASTVLSRLVSDALVLEELEVLKAFSGVDSHETRLAIPVFTNDQDMSRLAARVAAVLDRNPETPGYLIAGHGLYTWGESLAEAVRHLEAFEFLFQCELEMRRVGVR